MKILLAFLTALVLAGQTGPETTLTAKLAKLPQERMATLVGKPCGDYFFLLTGSSNGINSVFFRLKSTKAEGKVAGFVILAQSNIATIPDNSKTVPEAQIRPKDSKQTATIILSAAGLKKASVCFTQ